ncbi:helix-turn-helix domain-containing protein [Achromobacter anxifer]
MSIFDRLKEERQRLGRTQTEFAAIGGVQKRAQINYEAGERSPDSTYLALLANAGVDVHYVLTGRRGASLPADEQLLLDTYRAAPQVVRNSALAVLLTAGQAPAEIPRKKVSQVFHGQVGQYVDAPQDQVTINMGGSKKRK